MDDDGAFIHNIDNVTIFKVIRNHEGHPNCIAVSRVTAVLLNRWHLPISGASAVEGLQSMGLLHLSINIIDSYNMATRLVIVQMEDTQIQSK